MDHAAGTAINKPNKLDPNEITTEFQKCVKYGERDNTSE